MSHDGTINHDVSEPYSKGIAIAVITTGISLALIFIASIFLYRGTLTDERNEKEIIPGSAFLQKIRAYEADQNTSLNWVDKKLGTVHIPIDLAMHRVVQDYRR